MKKSIRKTLFSIIVTTVFIIPFMGNTACATVITFYFDDYDSGLDYWTNPAYMVDGNENTYASSATVDESQYLNSTSCEGTDLGTITEVHIRAKGYWSGNDRQIFLRPIFGERLPGDLCIFNPSSGPPGGWSDWYDITDDANSHQWWTWEHVRDLECEVQVGDGNSSFTVYCSIVQIRVTYTI